MTRRILACAAAAWLIGCGGDGPDGGIRRHVEIGPAGTVRLGEPPADSLRAARVADTLYEIRPDPAAGRRVRMRVGANGRVTAVEVTHWPSTRFDSLVEGYRLLYGAPTGRIASDEGVETVWWDDGRTHLEVRRRGAGPMARVTSRLADATEGVH